MEGVGFLTTSSLRNMVEGIGLAQVDQPWRGSPTAIETAGKAYCLTQLVVGSANYHYDSDYCFSSAFGAALLHVNPTRFKPRLPRESL